MESEVFDLQECFQYLDTDVMGRDIKIRHARNGREQECILPRKHFQCAWNWYLCSHLADTELTVFLLSKTNNSVISEVKLIPRNWSHFWTHRYIITLQPWHHVNIFGKSVLLSSEEVKNSVNHIAKYSWHVFVSWNSVADWIQTGKRSEENAICKK